MHRETFGPPLYFRLLGGLLLAVFVGMGVWFIFGLSREVDGFVLLFSFVPGFALLAISLVLLFARITFRVDEDGATLRFSPIHTTRISPADIASAELTEVTIWSYGGTGLRGIPGGGFAFLFQGGRALKLTTRSGRSYVVRSDRPEAALDALQAVKRDSSTA